MKKLLGLALLTACVCFGQTNNQVLNSGRVGPSPTADGAIAPIRQGRDASLVTQDSHGRYQEAVLRGNVFQACDQAGVATTVALGTTATGFILTNPAQSTVNLVLLEVIAVITAAPGGAAPTVLAANVNPVAVAVVHTTPLVVRNALLGPTRTGFGLADSAATLPAAPVVVRGIPGGPLGAASLTSTVMKDEVAGAIVLTPGTAVSTFSFTTALTAAFCMTWEEVPQ